MFAERLHLGGMQARLQGVLVALRRTAAIYRVRIRGSHGVVFVFSRVASPGPARLSGARGAGQPGVFSEFSGAARSTINRCRLSVPMPFSRASAPCACIVAANSRVEAVT